MLSGSDGGHLANMGAYIEEFQIISPVGHDWGATMQVTMPFLSNLCDIKKGELFVLPHGGGSAEIFAESPADSPGP